MIAWLESLTGAVAITAVTLAELLAGVHRLPAGRRKDALTASISEAVEPFRLQRAVLPFDDRAAERYADIVVAHGLAGLSISTADAQVAAICRVHDATCATRNIKDFVHTGVELIDPWNAARFS